MRIREILFHDFRSFRGQRRISFVDPLTDTVRPMSVIAGTNGTGKTTILDTMEALLALVLEPDKPRDLVVEAEKTGLICLTLELFQEDLPQAGPYSGRSYGEDPKGLQIAVGRRDLTRFQPKDWPDFFYGGPEIGLTFGEFRQAVSLMMNQGRFDLHGGLLYFPHDRQLGATRGGPIEPPPEERSWLFRFSPTDHWPGSLEQLWVWQNYLDLEQGSSENRSNLKPFVETVEEVLGSDRPITITRGQAQVLPSWSKGEGPGTPVYLDQLPSGEQQVLLLFGELARRRRKGAVIAIDEVENSLHPTLQRLVVHRLRQFAREWDMQVVLATHSLEVLRAAHGSERINLDRLEDPESASEEVR
jgi:energy-coupling factor transporter ATP-binding protein EcfA2